MVKVLVVETSPNGSQSASRKISQKFLETLKVKSGSVEVKTRDLFKTAIPHLAQEQINAWFKPEQQWNEADKKAMALSNTLVDELLWADEIVLAVPMWNFGLPSVAKAWLDHIVRAGRTFAFTDKGLVGHASGRKVHLIVSSGSVFSEGPYAAYDALVPQVRSAFGFIGITDVNVIRVEGTNDVSAQSQTFQKAETQIERIFS